MVYIFFLHSVIKFVWDIINNNKYVLSMKSHFIINDNKS